MDDIISDYQKWKQQGEDLRVKAKSAMQSRFGELLLEAARVAEEYRNDFGGVLKPPPIVTSFRYKAGKSTKKRAVTKAAADTKIETKKPAPVVVKPTRKVLGLQQRLATAKKKLEAAKTAGAPTRIWDDRIYEIEDALQSALRARE
jgi:hypothetical protein